MSDLDRAIDTRYVDLAQFAAGVGIHWATAVRLVHEGRLPATKVLGRKWMVERSVYEHWTMNYSSRPGRKQYPGQVTS